MKLQSFFATAVAVLLVLSSCSKENNGIPGETNDTKALVSVSFTLPTNNNTRSQTEQNATAEESNVKDVSVYVFNLAGAAVAKNSYTYLQKADFDAPVGNLYKLSAGKEIETVAGGARIYVGINIPASLRQAYDTEADLLYAVADLDEIKTDHEFTMISEAKVVSLQSVDDVTVNVVPIEVGRVVSKVVGSWDPSGSFVSTWKAADMVQTNPTASAVDITLTYTPSSYGIYQYAVKTFLAENQSTLINNLAGRYNPADVVKPFDYAIGGNTTLYNGHGDENRTFTDCVYIGENTPASTMYGNTTYAYIATKVDVSHYATWNDTNKEVVYQSGPYGNSTNDNVWVIHYDGVDVLTNSQTNADEIITGLNAYDGLAPDAPGKKIATYHIYYEGFVHFRVYLNRNGANDYRVGRNEYIHLRVNGVNANLGAGVFPGNPGEETDPEDKPVDPNENGGTEGPDPTDPTDPIDPADAKLSVEITVKPWTYKANNIILE